METNIYFISIFGPVSNISELQVLNIIYTLVQSFLVHLKSKYYNLVMCFSCLLPYGTSMDF